MRQFIDPSVSFFPRVGLQGLHTEGRKVHPILPNNIGTEALISISPEAKGLKRIDKGLGKIFLNCNFLSRSGLLEAYFRGSFYIQVPVLFKC